MPIVIIFLFAITSTLLAASTLVDSRSPLPILPLLLMSQLDKPVSPPRVLEASGMANLVENTMDASRTSPQTPTQILSLPPQTSSSESEKDNGGAELTRTVKQIESLPRINSSDGSKVVPKPKELTLAQALLPATSSILPTLSQFITSTSILPPKLPVNKITLAETTPSRELLLPDAIGLTKLVENKGM